jgi:hypothetical protein
MVVQGAQAIYFYGWLDEKKPDAVAFLLDESEDI